jgi:deoxyribose-phosphate aldolase
MIKQAIKGKAKIIRKHSGGVRKTENYEQTKERLLFRTGECTPLQINA